MQKHVWYRSIKMTSICLRGILIYRSELQIEPWGTRVRPAVEKGRPGTIVLSSMVFCALLRKRSKRQQLIQKSEDTRTPANARPFEQ